MVQMETLSNFKNSLWNDAEWKEKGLILEENSSFCLDVKMILLFEDDGKIPAE